LLSEKIAEMTLKVDQGHWRCHITPCISVCNVSISYRFRYIKRVTMACPWNLG